MPITPLFCLSFCMCWSLRLTQLPARLLNHTIATTNKTNKPTTSGRSIKLFTFDCTEQFGFVGFDCVRPNKTQSLWRKECGFVSVVRFRSVKNPTSATGSKLSRPCLVFSKKRTIAAARKSDEYPFHLPQAEQHAGINVGLTSACLECTTAAYLRTYAHVHMRLRPLVGRAVDQNVQSCRSKPGIIEPN